MRKGEFGGLLQAPFIASSTSHDHFKTTYKMPKTIPHPPIEEVFFFIKMLFSWFQVPKCLK